MKVTIESTSEIISLSGLKHRLWKGETESGIKVDVLVSAIGVDVNEPRKEEFYAEFEEINLAFTDNEKQSIPQLPDFPNS